MESDAEECTYLSDTGWVTPELSAVTFPGCGLDSVQFDSDWAPFRSYLC